MSVTRLTLIGTHHVHNHSIAPTDALYATEPAGDGGRGSKRGVAPGAGAGRHRRVRGVGVGPARDAVPEAAALRHAGAGRGADPRHGAGPPVGQVPVWPYVDDGGRRANLGGRGIAAAAIRMVCVTTTDSPGSSAQGSSHARFASTAG
jgi:hypothetical protein